MNKKERCIVIRCHKSLVLYYAGSLEEESQEGYPEIIPVGRGLSTMTRPTT